ncbi:unnamed protein product [Microthlaspi erraticum]|uniref:C-JID domain-containing protein n=1 Tax=Microthlaspi erraticum TaxID=1685480 RepID=A0A6D2L1N1_9BRAS|nr:unnamed protein product [Microthlaspi erraticum]
MHSLVEEMGKELSVHSPTDPGEWEFLTDSKNVCDVLKDGTGTKKIIGVSLDIDEIDELRIHYEAFKRMRNLRFLNIYTKRWGVKEEFRCYLHEDFNYLPPQLRLLRWDGCPMRRMPSSFCPENLVKIQMQGSKLEKLWEGIHSLPRFKDMDLSRSTNLKEIPNLSMATALETLNLGHCSSLVELPSFIQYLQKLKTIDMSYCENLEILPTGVNLKSLEQLTLSGCSRLKSFPEISTNISALSLEETGIEEFPPNLRLENLVYLNTSRLESEKLWERVQPLTPLMAMISPSLMMRLFLTDIPTLVELPSSFQNLSKLETLIITDCINLETLPNGINFESLSSLSLSGCSRLTSFPDISTNISLLLLDETGIEEVPWWIENFSNLDIMSMKECKSLKHVSLNISKLKRLWKVDFSDCGALTEVSLNDSPCAVAMVTDNHHSKLSILDEDEDDYHASYMPSIDFKNCFNLNQEALVETLTVLAKLILPGEEVPSHFTHQASGNPSSLTIPLLPSFLSKRFFRVRVCVVVMSGSDYYGGHLNVKCQFKGRSGKKFEYYGDLRPYFNATEKGSNLFIFDCRFRLYEYVIDAPPQAELNYDHVDIELHATNLFHENGKTPSRLKRWGVRLLDDNSTAENGLGSPNTLLPHVCEADEDNMVIDECHETEQGHEECGDISVEAERCTKRMRTT